jgi:hypothetical protein
VVSIGFTFGIAAISLLFFLSMFLDLFGRGRFSVIQRDDVVNTPVEKMGQVLREFQAGAGSTVEHSDQMRLRDSQALRALGKVEIWETLASTPSGLVFRMLDG